MVTPRDHCVQLMSGLVGVLCALMLVCFPVDAVTYRGTVEWFYPLGPATQEALAPLFEQLYAETGIKVAMSHVDYGVYQQKTTLRAAAGELPGWLDFGTEFAPMVAANAIQPLDGFIRADRYNTAVFDPTMLRSMQLNGVQYELPHSATTMVLWYNRDLFDEAGVAYPAHDWTDARWNWDAFVAAARKLTRFDAAGQVTQTGISGMQTWWVWPWYWGGDWVSADLKSYTGDSPETIKAIQSIADLANVHRVMDGSIPFTSGRAAMTVDGIWGIQNLVRGSSKVSFNWDIAATPIGTHHSVVYFVDGFAIGTRSKEADLAWEVHKWMLSKERLVDFLNAFRAHQAIPSRPDVRGEWIRQAQEAYPGVDLNVIGGAVQYAQFVRMRYLTTWPEINSTIGNAVNSVMSGSTSAQSALSAIRGKVQELIDQGQLTTGR